MKNINDEMEAKKIVEKIYPDSKMRSIALSILAEAINEVNTYGRDKWAIRVEDRVRLTIGHYYTCTLSKSGVWLALDNRSGNYLPTLNELKAWGWTPDESGKEESYPSYKDKTRKVDFSRNGFYKIGPNHNEAWPHIRRLFFDFIYKAIYYGQSMDSNTPNLHSSGALKYIRNELGINVPDPLYH